ncbi:MAG: hypothetical protein Q9195_003845 [Heterodermia aff. obscurata]
MTTTPKAQYPQAWWDDKEWIKQLRSINMDPQMVWSHHNWDHWTRGGKATDLQLRGWQEKGLYGAYFPDNERWQKEWKWLMSLPIGKPILESTHPNWSSWSSSLLPENSATSPRTTLESQESPRGDQLETRGRKSAIGSPIEGPPSHWNSDRDPRRSLARAWEDRRNNTSEDED